MTGFLHAPGPLILIGTAAAVTGALLLVLLCWHLVRRLLDVPRVPLRGGVYAMLLLICAVMTGAGVLSYALASALADWTAGPFTGPVAEVRCRREGGRHKLLFATIGADGRRGADELVDAGHCVIAGETLRFRPPLDKLGLSSAHRVSAVGGAARPRSVPAWRGLPTPFGVELGTLRIDTMEVPPNDRVHRVHVKPDGYWIEKPGG